MPELEHEQLPQTQGVIAFACQVFPYEMIDECLVEVTALPRAWSRENV